MEKEGASQKMMREILAKKVAAAPPAEPPPPPDLPQISEKLVQYLRDLQWEVEEIFERNSSLPEGELTKLAAKMAKQMNGEEDADGEEDTGDERDPETKQTKALPQPLNAEPPT